MSQSKSMQADTMLPARTHYPAASLRAGLALWLYFCTSLPIIKFLFYTALLCLPVSLLGGLLYSPRFGFGVGIFIFISALVFPLLVAAPQQRLLLASRRLCHLPGFPLTTGLVLLGMTIMASVFLPILARLYDSPGPVILLALQIFVLASLYLVVIQHCMVSRHAMPLLSTLPVLFILLMHQYPAAISQYLMNALFVQMLALACLAGWVSTLLRLHKSTTFKIPHNQAGVMMLSYDHHQSHYSFNWQVGIDKAPSAQSLLFGHAASLPNRILFLGTMVFLSPLVCSALVFLLAHEGVKRPSMMGLLFLFHLFIVVCLPWAWGELAARSRLLWLRVGGDRRVLWKLLERQLWASYAVMFGYTLILLLLLLVLEQPPSSFQWTVLGLVIVFSIHNGWLNLLARLQYWAPWVQAVAMIATLVIFVVALISSGVSESLLPLLVLMLAMTSLILYYRVKCRRLFARVDWLKLKPQNFGRPMQSTQ